MLMGIVVTLCLFFTVWAYDVKNCSQMNFLPMPHDLNCNLNNKKPFVMEDPCRILYHVKGDEKKTNYSHFEELIKHQQLKTFSCHISNVIIASDLTQFQLNGFVHTVEIQVQDPTLKSAFTVKEEAYEAHINENSTTLKADHYVGFVHALETFLQAIECPRYKTKNCELKHLPLIIKDQPDFMYRGIMVDTSRHFLPIHLLYETVDAMMYNKMSVFHWHITDEDAFPLILQSHPQIAKHAAFSDEETYTSEQARDLVRYALVRGIRVVPELDTPGHAASWGLAPQNKGVACTFGSGYMGPLDVTLDKTYTLVKEVFAEIIDIFPDPIIHLGGDEVVLTCLQNKTEFVKQQGIKDSEIQRHYRRKQHKIIKSLDPTKTPMYWMNSKINVEDEDIVHWWGGGMPQTSNKVVISNYGPYYLDMGVGNYYAVSYGQYSTWLDLYHQDLGKAIEKYNNKENVLGAEVTLWSEINNRYTHHMKIWIRSSSTAERTWTTKKYNPKPDFFRRITAHERLMNRRGIPTAPGTCQQCQTHPEFC